MEIHHSVICKWHRHITHSYSSLNPWKAYLKTYIWKHKIPYFRSFSHSSFCHVLRGVMLLVYFYFVQRKRVERNSISVPFSPCGLLLLYPRHGHWGMAKEIRTLLIGHDGVEYLGRPTYPLIRRPLGRLSCGWHRGGAPSPQDMASPVIPTSVVDRWNLCWEV
jgi:hypothetical protein